MFNANVNVLSTLIKSCKKFGKQIDLAIKTIPEETPLHYAAFHGNCEGAKILLQYLDISQVNIQDESGRTAYHLASESNNYNSQAIEKLIKQSGGKKLKLFEKKPFDFHLPSFVDHAYLADQTQVDEAFGGAIWDGPGCNIETYWPGKPFQVGLSVKLKMNFNRDVRGKNFSWMRGIISSIAEDEKSFTATVRMNVDHERLYIDDFPGDWHAKFEFDSSKTYPWIVTKLVREKNPERSYENMLKIAAEREQKYGRRLPRKIGSRCALLKGFESTHTHSDHAPRIITGIDLNDDGNQIVTHYEGDEPSQVTTIDPFNFGESRSLTPLESFMCSVEKNMTLIKMGKPPIRMRVNGEEMQREDLESMIATREPPKKRGSECIVCRKVHSNEHKLKRCTGCQSVYYCGSECQKKHWPAHRSKMT